MGFILAFPHLVSISFVLCVKMLSLIDASAHTKDDLCLCFFFHLSCRFKMREADENGVLWEMLVVSMLREQQL